MFTIKQTKIIGNLHMANDKTNKIITNSTCLTQNLMYDLV